MHLRVKISPALTVIDDSIDPRPKLRIHRITEFLLPPEIKRQVGIQMREHYAWQQARTTASEQKGNLFRANLLAPGAANVTVGADPGFHPVFLCLAIGLDHDGAAGVVLSNLRHQLRILV